MEVLDGNLDEFTGSPFHLFKKPFGPCVLSARGSSRN
nr:MAG TPA: hypothetical protein [Caudoviricetes sp.]